MVRREVPPGALLPVMNCVDLRCRFCGCTTHVVSCSRSLHRWLSFWVAIELMQASTERDIMHRANGSTLMRECDDYRLL